MKYVDAFFFFVKEGLKEPKRTLDYVVYMSYLANKINNKK